MLLFCQTYGQFPIECSSDENLRDKICCPNNCNGRGSCVDVTSEAMTQWNRSNSSIVNILQSKIPNVFEKIDSRLFWPTQVFTRVCQCNGNFFGPSCSECKFGWSGSDCSTMKETIERRSFYSLSDAEKRNFTRIIRMAKDETTLRWAIISSESSVNTTDPITLQPVSTYDLFVYLHFLTTREKVDACKGIFTSNSKDSRPDFGHEGPAFLTWHRYFLLFIERELQKISNNDNFALPYWDWEKNDGREIMKNGYLGEFDFDYMYDKNKCRYPKIESKQWITVCDKALREKDATCSQLREVCNVAEDLTKGNNLCRNGTQGITMDDDRRFPAAYEIVEALNKFEYENKAEDYTWIQSVGFRNALEGFVGLHCDSSTLMLSSDEKGNEDNAHGYLHNAVHLYISGHMFFPPSASNDPIFFLHHANIDRIFEMWLRKYPNATYYPETGAHPGHNRDDWLVPLFPLMTNGEVFKRSSELGYEYEDLNVPPINSCDPLLKPPDDDPGSFAVLKPAVFLSVLFPLVISMLLYWQI